MIDGEERALIYILPLRAVFKRIQPYPKTGAGLSTSNTDHLGA